MGAELKASSATKALPILMLCVKQFTLCPCTTHTHTHSHTHTATHTDTHTHTHTYTHTHTHAHTHTATHTYIHTHKQAQPALIHHGYTVNCAEGSLKKSSCADGTKRIQFSLPELPQPLPRHDVEEGKRPLQVTSLLALLKVHFASPSTHTSHGVPCPQVYIE